MTETIFNANTAKLARTAAEAFAQAVAQILAKKDYAVVVLPGGRSVIEFFKVLKTRADIDWNKIHFFMLDERLVGMEDEDSNFRQAYEQLFLELVDGKKLSWHNLHPFTYQPQALDKGIKSYENELKQFGGKYDIVIAGVGADGHTAALFPNHKALQSQDNFVMLADSPKSPAGRMTSSVKLIQTATVAFVFFIGTEKQKAYKNFLDKNTKWQECPAKILQKIKTVYIVTNL